MSKNYKTSHWRGLMKSKKNYQATECQQATNARIERLELILTELQNANMNKYFSRKQLASYLSCSERFISNNPDFKSIVCYVGARVYYPADGVDTIIRTKKGESNAKR
jgi:hypothetical protein